MIGEIDVGVITIRRAESNTQENVSCFQEDIESERDMTQFLAWKTTSKHHILVVSNIVVS